MRLFVHTLAGECANVCSISTWYVGRVKDRYVGAGPTIGASAVETWWSQRYTMTNSGTPRCIIGVRRHSGIRSTIYFEVLDEVLRIRFIVSVRSWIQFSFSRTVFWIHGTVSMVANSSLGEETAVVWGNSSVSSPPPGHLSSSLRQILQNWHNLFQALSSFSIRSSHVC